MKTEVFNELVERVVTRVKNNLVRKGKEYGADDDRFYNFRVAAKMEPPPQGHEYLSDELATLKGMQLKHKVSVRDILTGKLENTEDNMFEKFCDDIAYTVLSMGLLQELRTKNEKPEYGVMEDKARMLSDAKVAAAAALPPPNFDKANFDDNMAGEAGVTYSAHVAPECLPPAIQEAEVDNEIVARAEEVLRDASTFDDVTI